MGFDINKINQMAMDKQQSVKEEIKLLDEGINKLTSQCLSYIDTEEFENTLQAIIEENIQKEYNPRNSDENEYDIPFWFDYGIYTDGTEINLYMALLLGTLDCGGYAMEEETSLPTAISCDIYKEQYNAQTMLNKVNEVQNKMLEKFTEFKLKYIKATNDTVGQINKDLTQNFLEGGKIYIHWD